MSRAERLLELLQILRRYRYPVSGEVLARKLGISLRTVYRDIASLQAQGARIEGEAGLGYLLQPGFVLPPLMFSEEEIEALVLGARWVAERADGSLGAAARDAIAKIAAVLPAELRRELESAPLLIGPGEPFPAGDSEAAAIRRAIRAEHKLVLQYCDAQGRASTRVVWPFALAYFDRVRVVVAWCELRGGFRHFRTDRIAALTDPGDRYPERRQVLMRRWREEQFDDEAERATADRI